MEAESRNLPPVPSEALLARTFEGSPSAQLLVAESGTVLAANATAERLFGYPRERMVGAPIELFVPGRYRAGHPELFRSYFAAPTTRLLGDGAHLYGLRSDGTELPVEIGLSPIFDGDARYVIASIVDVSVRLRGEELLRASLAEKDTLLREIHHRVKNNMQVVSSLLSLQASRFPEDAERSAFEDCQARVQVMALVHEKLYSAGNLASLDAASYLADLVRLVVRSNAAPGADVEVQTSYADVSLELETAIPVGIVLHELLVNVYRHSGAGRPVVVRVEFTCVEDDLVLAVRDDGRGLPAGFDPARSGGLGLRLVRGLVRQIDGVLTWGGPGCWFAVRFPARSERARRGAVADAAGETA